MYMAKKFDDLGIQAVVAPLFPSCAFKPENGPELGLILDYTLLWNTIHFPAGSVPVTTV